MVGIINKIEKLALSHDRVSPELIKEKNIKLGLRNVDGSGVVVGITSKGLVVGYEKIDNKGKKGSTIKPAHGRLFYCQYNVKDLVESIHSENRFGFDEISFLLLTGELPSKSDLKKFSNELVERRPLTKRERSIIIEEGLGDNQMFALHSVVSHLMRCDPKPYTTDIRDVSRQCVNLIAKFPTIVAYNYNMMKFGKGSSLKIIKPDPNLSTAENFLYMLRGKRPTEFEAYTFDMAMTLHAEHGGGNNSTFTVRTVSSSGANTYMAICSGIASLSGHLHGGANEAVIDMMKDIRTNVKDWKDNNEIKSYLGKILKHKAWDRSGKIHGMGHAVYTLSDPRAVLLREKAKQYADFKGMSEEFDVLDKVAEIASTLLFKKIGKIISPNVDFYSGFIYKLMGIPKELFTPIFAMARVVGWSSHRIEQIVQNKIIRPGYVSSHSEEKNYKPQHKRN